jgi:hypothetical protein
VFCRMVAQDSDCPTTGIVQLRLRPKKTSVSNYILFVRFEVFTAETMKNVIFWDIKTQFVLHRRHVFAS